jgi:hypothetical protein
MRDVIIHTAERQVCGAFVQELKCVMLFLVPRNDKCCASAPLLP